MRKCHRAKAALCSLAAGLLLSTSPVAAGAIGAVVVGIDRYVELRNLKGAVADANDITSTLRKLNVEVELLTDAQANRDAILQAWHRLVERSMPGDTLILTIAGHGAQEKARHPGSESDERDEVFVLGGFTKARPGNGQRIFDDEFYELFSVVPKDRNVIFVSDTCHSGTMFRSADPRVTLGETRYGNYGEIEDDELPPPSAERPVDKSDLSNLFFYSSSTDREATPEVGIDGRYRGALSWALARALEGQADANRDNAITHGELQEFLYQRVKELSGERQHPRAEPSGRNNDVVIPLSKYVVGGEAASAGQQSVEIKLAAFNASGDVGSGWLSGVGLSRIEPVSRSENPDLIIDIDKREVLTSTGDIVSTGVSLDTRTLGPILDKWRLIKLFSTRSQSAPLRLDLLPSDGRHKEGDVLQIRIGGGQYRHTLAFALSADGTVNVLFPLRHESSEVGSSGLSFKVTPVAPFGADHVFAISTELLPGSLIQRLHQYEGKRIDEGLLSDIVSLADRRQLGLQAIYTYRG